MQEAVAFDHFRAGIGEKGERIARALAQIGRNLWRINANGDGTNPFFLKFLKAALNTS